MANDIPARPRSNDPEVIKAAVQEILPDVITWLESGGDLNADEKEVTEELCRAVRHKSDGYDIARQLENIATWDPDADLVQILDGFSTRSAHLKAVADWAKFWGTSCDWKVGDRAIWQDRPGEVRNVRANTTEITFLPDDIRDTSAIHHPDGLGMHGYVCFADDLTPEVAT